MCFLLQHLPLYLLAIHLYLIHRITCSSGLQLYRVSVSNARGCRRATRFHSEGIQLENDIELWNDISKRHTKSLDSKGSEECENNCNNLPNSDMIHGNEDITYTRFCYKEHLYIQAENWQKLRNS